MHELVERARHGDHDAFAALVGLTIDRMNATAWLIARDRTIAEDAVQEACLRAWRDLPSLRDPGPLVGDASSEVVLRDALERAFRRLSPEHRAVVVLTHLDELSTRESAEVLGIPLGTVKSRLHHALRGLRAALEADARLPTRSEGEPA